MKTLDYNKIEYYKNNKFKFDIGKYFNQSLELFQNNWQPFVIYALVAAIIYVFTSFTVIGLLFVMYPLLMGFMIGAERAENKMTLEVGDFFGGFKNIGSYFLFTLIIIGVSLAVMSPYIIFSFLPLMLNDPENVSPTFVLGSSLFGIMYLFAATIFLLFLQACIFLAPYFIHYGNMGAVEAIKTSYAIVKKNFWWMVLMALVVSLVASIGTIACYVGALATYPIGYMMVYFMLKEMILTDDEKTEIDLLGTNQE
ncbi:hypothetical protein [Empedobacter brevis]|uniref:hypothetical protein n=1 Tax=Empedobacter brevis TaxID=247 RepID=UPI002FE42813